MKIDNDYILKIITTMENHQSYEIDILELLTEFNITDEEVHKFYDHLKYMKDNGFIKSENQNLGIQYGIRPKDIPVIRNCKINLTNKEFTTEKRELNMTTNNINIQGDVHNSPIITGDHVTQSTEYNITNNDLKDNFQNQFNELKELIKQHQDLSKNEDLKEDIEDIAKQLSKPTPRPTKIINACNNILPIVKNIPDIVKAVNSIMSFF